MDAGLWILQGALALLFLGFGAAKLARSREQLAQSGEQMAWVEDFSARQVRLIGLAEVLAAAGLVLPPLLDVLPWLAAAAALGLAALMAGALWTHRRRGEPRGMAIAGVLLALAALVAVGRLGPERF